MEKKVRKPLQGITNIIWFNWHYYVIAFVLITGLYFANRFIPHSLQLVSNIILLLVIAGIVISLVVSWYIYDYTELYSLNWLNNLNIGTNTQLVNITAGFDETSSTLVEKYQASDLLAFDFYDPVKHTEISIERARKAYPAYPGTKTISTDKIPLKEKSADFIFLIFAAHEIRNNDERIQFFRQLGNSLKKDAKIIVTEHQRDIYNFIAYNFGFCHFLSGSNWKRTFNKAGLNIKTTFKINPFITTFILTKDGTAI
jgi:hypothetical protein